MFDVWRILLYVLSKGFAVLGATIKIIGNKILLLHMFFMFKMETE